MWILLVVFLGVTMAEDTEPVSNERTSPARILAGYPGIRNDLFYEAYVDPYYFPIGNNAVAEVKALNSEGMPVDGPRGIVTLEQKPNGIRIAGTINGLTPGKHGFHVHEKGDLRTGCTSAGAHFNPYLTVHGSRHDPLRHVGDLGNIEANADGVANVDILDHYLTLNGVRGAVGRALVVHEKPDDLGRGGTEDSLTTGSAGGRVACGVIGYA